MREPKVIVIKNRFFYKFNKLGRVMTAWSLAGSEVFLEETTRFNSVIKKLQNKKIDFQLKTLQLKNIIDGIDLALLVPCDSDDSHIPIEERVLLWKLLATGDYFYVYDRDGDYCLSHANEVGVEIIKFFTGEI